MNHREIERWYRLRMLKKASVAVVLSVLALIVICGAAWRLMSDGPPETPTADTADAALKVNRFTLSSSGEHPWRLDARTALSKDSTLQRVALIRPRIVYQGGKGGVIVLTAEKGIVDRDKLNYSAKGNVTLKYRDFEISTEEITYSEEKQEVSGSATVVLKAKDLHFTGNELTLSLADEEIVIKGGVSATLFNMKWTTPSLHMNKLVSRHSPAGH